MGRVLLVDDDRLLLSALARHLKRAGHTVVACRDFQDALEALRTDRFDHLVTDYRVGSDNGLDLVCAAQALADPPRCILMSGSITREEADDIIVRGVARVFVKPFPTKDLLDALGH